MDEPSVEPTLKYWIVKSEPFKYSWDDFVNEKRSVWEGVRNYQARNNLMAMHLNDLVLFYHSNEGKEIVGLARVVREHYPDPTTDDSRWVVVDLEPVERFPKTVPLARIKADSRLQELSLVRQSRLSVLPLHRAEFDILVGIAYE
ncbi:EVE domain-containing protein [Salmonirosea aquatica]|uniref:EVE domain-containing protein n=1 Tax=Salmonirosea aquatica TaxID=2654236 RepID=A0A7C9BI49_9BACT|nr:EVE domain-containing protein [Cytophagaceae bacterium SJW1-29]